MTTRPTWRLVDSGASDGYTNMAVDEAIMLAVQEGVVPPTVRFYAWQPPCLSLGTFQSVSNDIDIDACARHGIDWVRRPTGGRAILHDREVTYSVAVQQDNDRVAGDIMESYRRISLGLLKGLRLLGIDADMAALPKGNNTGSPPGPTAKPAACFAAPSQHEITVAGRKIIGSAQRRQGTMLLQHGSLLLDLDVDTLVSLLHFPSQAERQAMANRVRRESVTLNELLGHTMTYPAVVPTLAAAFASALEINLVPDRLSPWEEAESRRLRRDKYMSDAWRYRK